MSLQNESRSGISKNDSVGTSEMVFLKAMKKLAKTLRINFFQNSGLLKTLCSFQEFCKKIYHANDNKKRARMVILISDKMDCNTKIVTREKEGHFIMIYES